MERHPHRKDQVLVPGLPESFEPIIGQSVALRPLRRDDIDIEAAFLTGLSPESRQNRLLGGMIQITREYLERLTTVDFSRDMALAAVLMLDGREVLIGVARSRGLTQIHGDVLSTNRPMLEFCRKLGFRLGRNPDDATVTRVTRALD